MKIKKKKVVVAISGGVDSAVAAILLKEKNFDLYAVHMQNWDVELNEKNAVVSDKQGCSNLKDLEDSKNICKALNIPLKIYNFVFEYWENVFEPYLVFLKNNLISNPDILCNKKIKFGVLLKHVQKDFGKDVKIATGHWAKILEKNGRYFLSTCKNKEKDQTYFLSRLSEKQLKNVFFPLSNIKSKDAARDIAKKYSLPIWNKKDSVGICFVGKRKYSKFVENYLDIKIGNLIDIETKKILGTHNGTHLYVLNQRKGLYLKGYEEKYYVCGKDVDKNIVFLCKKSSLKKYLYSQKSICENIHWINDKLKKDDFLYIKTRHSKFFLKSQIMKLNKNTCELKHKNTFITSPGQYIVFYSLNKKICLGCAIYKGC